jgi:hypothetical protein
MHDPVKCIVSEAVGPSSPLDMPSMTLPMRRPAKCGPRSSYVRI